MTQFYISGRNVDGTSYLCQETTLVKDTPESWTSDHFDRGLWSETEAKLLAAYLEEKHAKHRSLDGYHLYGIVAKEVPATFRRRTPEEQAALDAEIAAEEAAIEASYPPGYFDDDGS
jgi:hypothetical protein